LIKSPNNTLKTFRIWLINFYKRSQESDPIRWWS